MTMALFVRFWLCDGSFHSVFDLRALLALPCLLLTCLFVTGIIARARRTSRQKSYHDKRRKSLEFQEGDHVFLRVTPITGVGRALKSKKLTPRFIGPYQILERIGEVAYRIALPPSLANLHDVFHVSQLRRYIHDPSHVVQVDDVQVRDNLTVETSPMRIEDRELKQLRGKEIALVKVAWGGPAGGNVTWELESQMKESYPELFA
ncbi:hypothetical protein KIW84_032932 [Lathyrus oleraceus]|uniref:Tf2-1-like SH3-like domain-containing protein n=1 Tax=Pisum sativum TaxID=3888 RepID=A0A9D4XVA4_PEA|nr:hypothetical protein KIW84_032932 [Pisum sativum]